MSSTNPSELALQTPAAPPQVLITFIEDPAAVLLVCPRPRCLAVDEIYELDQATRFNSLTWYVDTDGIGASLDKNADFHHTEFRCIACGSSVSMPDDIADEITWD